MIYVSRMTEDRPTMRDDSAPTRWTLVSRLKDWRDQESWQEFFDTYWKLIYGAAVHSGLTDAEAQEVVQETVITVAKKMPEFKADPAAGSFKGWLLQITTRRIVDQLRKRPPPGRFHETVRRADETARTPTVERVPEPASLNLNHRWNEEWQKNLVDAAIERVKRTVNPKAYKIFYLHVLKKIPAGRVAKALGVNIAQVYLAKSRVSALVKKEVRRLEGQSL
jgi:RNA polymerase sigma factor (sigma-70 family)